MSDVKKTIANELENKVMVDLDRYKELLKAETELTALENGGVDNWEGYSDALRNAGFFDDEEGDEDA